MNSRPRAHKSLFAASAILLAWSAHTAYADVAVCATEQAISCAPYEPCDRSLPGAMNLPVLMKIDTEATTIASLQAGGGERSSRISSVAETEQAHLIHGADEHRPWVVQIDKATGRFTGTIAGSGIAFVLFGECTWELVK
jgi:hypothetical protein